MTATGSKASVHVWKNIRKVLDSEAKHFSAHTVKKLYMQDGLLAINKPYNLPVHSGPKQINSVMDIVPGIEERFGLSRGSLHLANRLDRTTSGVLLMTYTNEMARYIADAYAQRRIEKQYLSVHVGIPKNTRRGELEAHIAERHFSVARSAGRRHMCVVEDDGGVTAKQTRTEYRVLDNNEADCSLIRFTTNTGVKHQIRVVALELLRCPVLGDHKYHDGPAGPQMMSLRLMQLLRLTGERHRDGKKRHIRPWQRANIPAHLIAHRVHIPGLEENEKMTTIEAPLPLFFRETLARCDLYENREEIEEREIMRRLLTKDEVKRRQMIETRAMEQQAGNRGSAKEEIIRRYIERRSEQTAGGETEV